MIHKLKGVLRLMRVHQYIKNIFIFLPLFFIGNIANFELVTTAFIAFISFSISASGVYALNDFLDIEYDRKHPKKKFRPLASKEISKNEGRFLIVLFFTVGIVTMSYLSKITLLVLLFYILMNIAYSLRLKHIAIIDVTLIAIGFVLRLFIGALATETPLSKWIVIMTFLLALFLALVKRRDDVIHFLKTGTKMRKVIDGYNIQLIDTAMMVMASVVTVSYLLYTTSPEVIDRIGNDYLYLTSFFVILGILRYMQITFVEENSGSPTTVLLKDPFIILNCVAWVVSYIYILYFS